jgi:hypothetical protein
MQSVIRMPGSLLAVVRPAAHCRQGFLLAFLAKKPGAHLEAPAGVV